MSDFTLGKGDIQYLIKPGSPNDPFFALEDCIVNLDERSYKTMRDIGNPHLTIFSDTQEILELSKAIALATQKGILSKLGSCEDWREAYYCIDSLPLIKNLFYAADRYLDDCYFVASCLFASDHEFKKNDLARHFLREAECVKYTLSIPTNHLKHNQVSLSTFTKVLDLKIPTEHGTSYQYGLSLPGFEFTKTVNGTLAAHVISNRGIHSYSVTGFLWSVLAASMRLSSALRMLLERKGEKSSAHQIAKNLTNLFSETVTALLTLPLYTYAETVLQQFTFRLAPECCPVKPRLIGSAGYSWPVGLELKQSEYGTVPPMVRKINLPTARSITLHSPVFGAEPYR